MAEGRQLTTFSTKAPPPLLYRVAEGRTAHVILYQSATSQWYRVAEGWTAHVILYQSTTSPCGQSGRGEDSSRHSLPERYLHVWTEWPRGGQLTTFSTGALPPRVYRVAEGRTAHVILYLSTTSPCVQSGRGEDSSRHSLPEHPLPVCTEWPRGGQLTTFSTRALPPRMYRVAEGQTAHDILYPSTTSPVVQSGRGMDSSRHSLPEHYLPVCTEWPRGRQLMTFST